MKLEIQDDLLRELARLRIQRNGKTLSVEELVHDAILEQIRNYDETLSMFESMAPPEAVAEQDRA